MLLKCWQFRDLSLFRQINYKF